MPASALLSKNAQDDFQLVYVSSNCFLYMLNSKIALKSRPIDIPRILTCTNLLACKGHGGLYSVSLSATVQGENTLAIYM